ELDLVQPARRLLPVSGDERERVPLVEERERGVDLPRRERQLVCDLPDQRIRKHEIQSSSRCHTAGFEIRPVDLPPPAVAGRRASSGEGWRRRAGPATREWRGDGISAMI